MARFYYGSRISDNMVRTPEGFLICSNVPIARTGTYQYLTSEVGLEGNEIIDVYREPSEVFSPQTIASFEGKTFTLSHPHEDVTVNNWPMYAKGEITKVRRGTGAESQFLMADIIVKDPIAIAEIESGKREVSAGYDCDYVIRDNKIYQTNIRGNHVALVDRGRAGKDVAIRDSASISHTTSKAKRLLITARYKLF